MGFRGFLLGIAVIVAAGLASANATERAVLVTSNFESSSLAVVDLATNDVSVNLLTIHSDAAVRTRNGKVYVINRLGQDNVIVLDEGDLSTPIRQFSVGNGTNPYDIAFASDEKAYVARLQAPSLLIVNPTTGDSLGAVDLSAFGDGDGMPEAAALVIHDGNLYVTCQRLELYAPTDYSVIAVVDLATDQVVDLDDQKSGVQGIVTTAKNPTAQVQKGNLLILSSVGSYGNYTDGGIEVVDLDQQETRGLVLTETDLGGDVGPLAMVDAEKGYVVVSVFSDGVFLNELKPFDLGIRSVGTSVNDLSGGYIPSIGVAGGKLYVSDQGAETDPTSGGLRVFDVTNNLLIAGPLNVGLPPGDIAFLGVQSGSGTDTRGPIALDLDTTAGDQKHLQSTENPKAGDQITVDIVAVSGAQGQIGFQTTLKYDPAQLEWVGFDLKGLFVTGVSLPGSPPNGEAVINVAILGGAASEDAGSMGHAKFKVLADVSGGAKVELTAAQYGTTPVAIGPGGAFVVIGGVSAPAIPTDPVERADFGGDGKVDFNDFLAFAGAFGSISGADNYDARIDLNDDGKVSFNDFLIFAGVFGQSIGG